MTATTGTVRVLAATALAVAAGVVFASQPGARPSASLTIRVRSFVVANSYHDTGVKGPSRGDVSIQRDRLVNVRRQFGKPIGATVGADMARITFRSATSARVSGIADFPGGTVRFAGSAPLDTVATFRITGGTGRFAGASGHVVVGTGDSPLNVYTLLTL